MERIDRVAIVGAGPAGIAAAVQLKRYGILPLWFESGKIGGLLWNANLVENYPGFPTGISGPDLIKRFEEQICHISICPTREQVVKITYERGLFHIVTDRGEYFSEIVIAASGTKPIELGDFDIPEAVRDRIIYEVHPIVNQVGMTVAILGAGDAAFDYALNLAERNNVLILNRGHSTKCLSLLWDRVQAESNIRYVQKAQINGILTDGSGRMVIEFAGEEGISCVQVDYLVGAIGRIPNISYFSDHIRDRSEILQSKGLLYFAGDVKNDIFRQVSIAVGDGVKTAMQVFQRMEGGLR